VARSRGKVVAGVGDEVVAGVVVVGREKVVIGCLYDGGHGACHGIHDDAGVDHGACVGVDGHGACVGVDGHGACVGVDGHGACHDGELY
jgi:hypothetical protein